MTQPIQNTEHYLNPVTPRVLWSPPDPPRDRPIMGALLGQHGALLVETGASPAHAAQFTQALAEFGGPPARYAAVTHWHWDHVFGTAALGLPTIGHVETRRRVLEMARLDWRDHALDARVASGDEQPFIASHVKVELTNAERARLVIAAPDITFTEQIEIDLGGMTAQVMHVGGDHAPDSSIIYAVEERVAFLGDCFYNGVSGPEDFYTLPRLLPLLERLESLPADYYILSHHPAPLSRAEFLSEASLLRRIGAVVAQAGGQRAAALAHLPAALQAPLTEDHRYYLDCFLNGLKPGVAAG